MKQMLKESLMGLDQPISIEESSTSFFRRNKIRVLMRYEDGSHKTFYAKMGQAYFITLKKRKYVVLPECFSKGKYPTIEYYFNNPFPIKFTYESCDLTPSQLWKNPDLKLIPKELVPILTSVCVDSETLQSAFDSNWLKSMYSKPGLTAKSLLFILGAIMIFVLVMLQVTGTVDVMSYITG